MNNKELQAELAKRMSITQKEAANFLNAFVHEYSKNFSVLEETQISFLKMGNFEINKKNQRVIINPISKNRMLVPPKLSLSFKPSALLKAKVKSLDL